MGVNDPQGFEAWRRGFGVVAHDAATVARVQDLATDRDAAAVFRVLSAADRLANAAMWVVAHMTYADRVDLSGAALPAQAFKASPEGHTGGSLNVVPAYVGYLAANVLTGTTRAWLLGQGHCVAAIEAVNALIGNLSPAQEGRYGPDEAGLSRLCADFYGYAVRPTARPPRRSEATSTPTRPVVSPRAGISASPRRSTSTCR